MQYLINKDALTAFHKVGKNQVAVDHEENSKSNMKVIMTEFDLGNNAHGRKCQIRFLELMRRDFENFHWRFVNSAGIAKLAKGVSANWLELSSRLPGYFNKKYAKGTAHWKKLSTEEKAVGFGGLVMKEFQAVAPKPDAKSTHFMKWLVDVHMLAPAVIAYDPKAEPAK